jgi:hypothetical protein
MPIAPVDFVRSFPSWPHCEGAAQLGDEADEARGDQGGTCVPHLAAVAMVASSIAMGFAAYRQ